MPTLLTEQNTNLEVANTLVEVQQHVAPANDETTNNIAAQVYTDDNIVNVAQNLLPLMNATKDEDVYL